MYSDLYNTSNAIKLIKNKIVLKKIKSKKVQNAPINQKSSLSHLLNENTFIFNNLNLIKAFSNKHKNSKMINLRYSNKNNNPFLFPSLRKKNITKYSNKDIKRDDNFRLEIHSNGKFKNNFNLSATKLKQKHTFYVESRKKPILNLNYSEISKMDMHKCLYKDLDGLNLSSHYLGNTLDNKFGITTNKFIFKKDINFESNNFPMDDFHSINIPKHNMNYNFNRRSGTSFIRKIKIVQKNGIKNSKLFSIKSFSSNNICNHLSKGLQVDNNSIIVLNLSQINKRYKNKVKVKADKISQVEKLIV